MQMTVTLEALLPHPHWQNKGQCSQTPVASEVVV